MCFTFQSVLKYGCLLQGAGEKYSRWVLFLPWTNVLLLSSQRSLGEPFASTCSSSFLDIWLESSFVFPSCATKEGIRKNSQVCALTLHRLCVKRCHLGVLVKWRVHTLAKSWAEAEQDASEHDPLENQDNKDGTQLCCRAYIPNP